MTNDMPKQKKDEMSEIKDIAKKNLRYAKSIHQFTPKDASQKAKQNQSTLDEILKYSQASYEILEKVQRWILWNRIFTFVKILIIVVPIVLGIIYLPPLLQNAFKPYIDLFQDVQDFQQ